MTIEQIRAIQALQSMQPVMVKEATEPRNGGVGVFVGPDTAVEGHVLVRFEDPNGTATAPQVVESFPVEHVQGL